MTWMERRRRSRCCSRARVARRSTSSVASSTGRSSAAASAPPRMARTSSRAPAEAVEVLANGAELLDRLGLGDDVELAPLVQEKRDMAYGLQPGAELALGLAHALGDGAHLSPARREQGDDPVGLPQPDRAEHNPRLAVQAHATIIGRLLHR